MLGLREQIDGDPRGIDGVVGDDRDLRRAREPVDADGPEDLTLRLGDVRVPGTDDHVDRPHAPAPNAIAAIAWAPPIAYTSSTSAIAAAARIASSTRPSAPGGEHRITSGTPATRAGSTVMSTDDASGAAARHVTAGTIDRNDELAHLDAETFVTRLAFALRLVPRDDLVASELERGAQARGGALERGVDLDAIDPGLGHVDAVEAGGQLPDGDRARLRTSAMIPVTVAPTSGPAVTGRDSAVRRSSVVPRTSIRASMGAAHRTGRLPGTDRD